MKLNCYSCGESNIAKICCSLISKIYLAEENALILVDQDTNIKLLDDLLWTYSNEFIPHATTFDEDIAPSDNPVFICSIVKYQNYNFAKHLIFFDIEYLLVENFCTKHRLELQQDILSISWIGNDFSNSYSQLQKIFTNYFEQITINFYSKSINNTWERN